jgi:ureidoglycolate amidohydrolase
MSVMAWLAAKLGKLLSCRYMKALMKEAGLTIREDPMGNIYGRMQGSNSATGVPLTLAAAW